jgi:hypothetical protein
MTRHDFNKLCRLDRPANRISYRKRADSWFKNGFYKFDGFSSTSWYPMYATLEELGMKKMADLLQKRNKPA